MSGVRCFWWSDRGGGLVCGRRLTHHTEGGGVDMAERQAPTPLPAWLAASSEVLHQASIRRAENSDAIQATVLQWGADLYVAEGTLRERTAAGAASDRAFLRAADSMVQRMADDPAPASTAADLLRQARSHLRAAADPGTQREIGRSWSTLDHLAGLAAPGHADLVQAADRRLGGVSPAVFSASRRARARAAMDAAQHHRIGGRTAAGIESAYESDLAVLDGALVDSAVAVGDPLLLSVTIRWELASTAISVIPALPGSVVAAAQRIRRAIVEALGPADGARVAAAFLPLS